MNKIFSRFFAIIAFAFISFPAFAESFEVDGIYYEIDSNNSSNAIVVSHPTGYANSSYSIPSIISYNNVNLTVTSIGESAFQHCKTIEEVILPNSIHVIGANAFSYCNNLVSITLSSSLTEIGHDAFYNCTKLPMIVLPSSLKSIGYCAFQNCSSITKIDIPSAVEVIGYQAFERTSISKLIIPQSVITIGKGIVMHCNNLETIEVEEGNSVYDSRSNCNAILKGNTLVVGCKNSQIIDGITVIGESAFQSCEELKSITLPNTILTIGANAFSYCNNLVSITLSSSLTEIGHDAFYNCTKLPMIVLPSSLKSIGYCAFQNCSSITKIDIPSAVEVIGYQAFERTSISKLIIPQSVITIGKGIVMHCNNLETIEVEEGNSVYDSRSNCNAILKGNTLVVGCKNSQIIDGITVIGESAFQSCEELKSITLPNTILTIGANAFYGCNNLVSIVLSESLEAIEHDAFYNCTKIESIEFPSSLNNIDNYAFQNCTKLLVIESKIENPFTINDKVFSDYNNYIYTNATLFVPEGKVEEYKETDGWKNFVDIREIEPDPTPVIGGLTYVIKKRAKFAEIQSASFVEHIVIPTSVEYENIQYPVTRILDSAFMGSKMLSLSIPSSVSYVGQNVLKDCNQLAAIVWNPSFIPSDEFVSHIANPNLLFYVAQEQYKPSGVRNVIIDDKASDIILTDESIGNFYCPKVFTAANISYTHNFSLKTEKGKCQGWESIALPFDVTTYNTSSGDDIKPYKIANTGEKLFWLRELTESGLVEAEGIKANVPYIISMPNWEGYQDFYNITGDVVFSAQDAKVEVTEIQPVVSGAHRFYPAFQMQTKNDSIYALNQEIVNDNAPGSIFVNNSRDIRPFEAYFTTTGSAAARRALSISDLMEGTTAIADIPETLRRIYSNNDVIYIESVTNGICSVYAVSGQLMRNVALKQGLNTVEGLSKGIYIVNGQKIMVK